MQPKYSQPEIERRWLVAVDKAVRLPQVRAKKIEDKYLSGGRLRLRKVSEENCEPIFKLGKKYLRSEASPESVVSIYLTESEFKVFLALPGRGATKTRYSVQGGALDVYEHPSHEHAIFEIEFESERAAAEYLPPEFVREEVTFNEKYTGFGLSEEAP